MDEKRRYYKSAWKIRNIVKMINKDLEAKIDKVHLGCM